MSSWWTKEPAMILAVLNAGLALGMGFGLKVSPHQLALISAFVSSVLGLITRSQVTSPAALQALTPATLAAAQKAPEPVKDTIRKLP